MSQHITCPRCGSRFHFAEAPLPGRLSCPHCRTDIQLPGTVQPEEPASPFHMKTLPLREVDIRRKSTNTTTLLIAMVVLLLLAIPLALSAQTERLRLVGITLDLAAVQIFLFLIGRVLFRVPWDETSWRGIFQSLAACVVLLALLVVSILVFLFTVCVISYP